MPPAVSSQITVRDVARVLFRHKGKALLAFAAVLGATVAITFLTPKVYRSQSELFVRLGRENVALDPVATLGHEAALAVPASREDEINSLVEVLQNRTLLERVVDSVGPAVILGREPGGPSPGGLAGFKARISSIVNPGVDDRERALLAVEQDLSVEPVKKSNILHVSYEAESPDVARRVVSILVDGFLEQHIQLNRTHGGGQFLAQEADDCRKRLVDAERELCALQQQTGLAAPDVQRQLLVARINELEDQLGRARVDLEASSAELRVLEEKLASLPATQVASKTVAAGDGGTDLIRHQHYGLELVGHQRSSIYTDAHPKLREILDQLPRAKADLEREPTSREQVVTSPNRSYEEVHLAWLRQLPVHSALQAKSKALQGELALVKAKLQKTGEDSLQIARLQREVDLQADQWRKYASTLEKARMDASLGNNKISNISIVQPASYSLRPIRPRIKMNLILGFVASVFAAVGVALAAEYFDDSLKSPEDVEQALGLPALSAIPLWSSRGNGAAAAGAAKEAVP